MGWAERMGARREQYAADKLQRFAEDVVVVRSLRRLWTWRLKARVEGNTLRGATKNVSAHVGRTRRTRLAGWAVQARRGASSDMRVRETMYASVEALVVVVVDIVMVVVKVLLVVVVTPTLGEAPTATANIFIEFDLAKISKCPIWAFFLRIP